jgi:hypothetical protein
MNIASINITTYQESTWGRVYIQYTHENELFYIFKNWLKFEEKVYKGIGDVLEEPAYNWFTENNRYVFANYQDVLDGKADDLYLTPAKYKAEYGTPSIILKRLLIELKANVAEPVEHRRGWFAKQQTQSIVLSEIVVTANNIISLPLYELEIKLPGLVKLVYLFFLKHPEGIRIVDLPDYKMELLALYEKLAVGSDKEKAQKSIDTLVNSTENSIHEKFSKIKKYLSDELGDKVAANYIISGNKGEAYKIAIEPSKVVFQK